MIKKIKSKEYALGVERMDKEVGAPIDIAQSSMLMAAYEAGWDGAMRHLGGMSVDDAIMELLLERIKNIKEKDVGVGIYNKLADIAQSHLRNIYLINQTLR